MGGGTRTGSGTSQGSPHVAGMLAVMMQNDRMSACKARVECWPTPPWVLLQGEGWLLPPYTPNKLLSNGCGGPKVIPGYTPWVPPVQEEE